MISPMAVCIANAPTRYAAATSGGPSNANVLEVLLDVEGASPLLSGMEVDVLFEGGDDPVAPASKPKKPAKTN